jgi:lipid-binding SYLF domain-containing protein
MVSSPTDRRVDDAKEAEMRIYALTLSLTLAVPAFAAADGAADRLDEAATTLSEIMQAEDQSIPRDLLSKAACAIIVPGLKKGAFVVGGKYGRGFALCRGADGWSAPAAVRVEGGSVGFQIGGSETDVFMLVMSQRGMDRLLSTKFTLGGDASVAGGPVGRSTTAQTDAGMRADILSWSRSRGVFAGIALDGATMRPDEDENRELYGKALTNREILAGTVPPTPAARRLVDLLTKYGGAKKS